MTTECKTYTVEEARMILGISRNTAYRAVDNGSLPSIRINNRILIPKMALHRMLESPTDFLDKEGN